MGDFHAPVLEVLDRTCTSLEHSSLAILSCKGDGEIYSTFSQRKGRNCLHEYIVVSAIVYKFRYCCEIRFSERERNSSIVEDLLFHSTDLHLLSITRYLLGRRRQIIKFQTLPQSGFILIGTWKVH